jgi:lysophospholipase L1-like esterase
LATLNGAIKQVARECGVPVADVWQAAVEELVTVPKPANYLTNEWLWRLLDRVRIRWQSPDQLSRIRRLHLTFDGVHPNSRGAALWAQVVWSALARAEGISLEQPLGP